MAPVHTSRCNWIKSSFPTELVINSQKPHKKMKAINFRRYVLVNVKTRVWRETSSLHFDQISLVCTPFDSSLKAQPKVF